MNLKAMAKKAASMKVHQMPDPPKPKNGKGNSAAQPTEYDPAEYMKRKPNLTLNSIQMPGIKGMKDMKMDEECVMIVKSRMTGYNQDTYMKGEAEATFEIQEIGVMPHDKT